MKTSKQMPFLLVVMVYMQDILLCRNKRVHWWNPLKFYWSLIALEIVRGHCTDNHGKLTLLNRKLVWKIADVPLLGFVVKHHFMCFFGAVLMLGSGLRPWLWWDQDLSGSAVLESPVAFGGGPDSWENCPRVPLVRSFPARPSSSETADGTAEPGRGALREKRWPFFFPIS